MEPFSSDSINSGPTLPNGALNSANEAASSSSLGNNFNNSGNNLSNTSIGLNLADQSIRQQNQTGSEGVDSEGNNYDSAHAYNFNSSGQVQEQQIKKVNPVSAVFKLLILMSIPLIATVGVGLYFVTNRNEEAYKKLRSVVLSVPMKDVNWQDLGTVFEPLIELPIKVQSGYERWEFLLDSGAVVSSLPREWAEKMGKDLAFMKRSTFRGFGGKTSFAYQGEMTILLGETEKTIPVVFTEAEGTKSLLGRKGFFEDFSVYFNHKEKQIEIRN
jgi:hypothetical protein